MSDPIIVGEDGPDRFFFATVEKDGEREEMEVRAPSRHQGQKHLVDRGYKIIRWEAAGDEETPSWLQSRSVAHCQKCGREITEPVHGEIQTVRDDIVVENVIVCGECLQKSLASS